MAGRSVTCQLQPLPDQQAAALVLVQVEQLDRHSFGPLAIRESLIELSPQK
jgi:hypothetical protein